MKKKENIIIATAFTLVELIVVITILAILGTIGFLSYQGYISTTRDTVRTADIGSIKRTLEYNKVYTGEYPMPDSSTGVLYNGITVWNQGFFGDEAMRSVKNLNKVPLDPKYNIEYTYSVTGTQKEYEISAVLESSTNIAYGEVGVQTYASSGLSTFIDGTYNGIATKISTPTGIVVLALPSITTTDLLDTDLKQILQSRNLTFNGLDCPPEHYGIDAGTCDTLLNPIKAEIFTGSIDEITHSQAKRVIMLKNLQNAYLGSNTTLSSKLEHIKNMTILPSGPNQDSLDQSDMLVSFPLGLEIAAELPSTVDPYSLSFVTNNKYTKKWSSNNCPTSINVKYVNPGEENIKIRTLEENTVYVLSSGNYIMDGKIAMNNCSALIGIGAVSIKSSAYITALISNNGVSNTIIDNVVLTGINGTPLKNRSGIVYISSSSNSTLKNVLTMNNDGRGISIENSSNIVAEDIVSINNKEYGFYILNSDNNIIEGFKTYNNTNASSGGNKGSGLYINNGDNNFINNALIFNNSYYGVILGTGSDYNVLNNISVFNNGYFGLRFDASTHNILNNSTISKNTSKELLMSSSASNTILNNVKVLSAAWQGAQFDSNTLYYGNFNNNTLNQTKITAAGTPNTFYGAGVIPITNIPFSTNQAIIPSGTWDENLSGRQVRSFNGTETYTFGSSLQNQIQPQKYNGTTLINFGNFDASKKIGE